MTEIVEMEVETLPVSLNTNSSNSLQDINWEHLDFKKFVAYGSVLLLGVRTLVYPSSLAKTRLQVQKTGVVYTSLFDVFYKVAKNEGIRGLYKGFGTTIFGVMPAQIIYLSSYEYVKQSVAKHEPQEWTPEMKVFGQNIIAGFMASVFSQVVVVPIDVIVQKQMIQNSELSHSKTPTGAIAEFRNTIKTSGVLGLYRGFHLSLMTYPPSSAIWWATYSSTKKALQSWREKSVGDDFWVSPNGQGIIIQTISGVSAGSVAAVLTTPLDVIKTRYQLSMGSAESQTISSTVKRLLQEEGWKGFTKGMSARALHMALPSTLMATVYELVKRLSVKED